MPARAFRVNVDNQSLGPFGYILNQTICHKCTGDWTPLARLSGSMDRPIPTEAISSIGGALSAVVDNRSAVAYLDHGVVLFLYAVPIDGKQTGMALQYQRLAPDGTQWQARCWNWRCRSPDLL